MPRAESTDALFEDHSDRLGRLETNYAEVASQLAAQSVQIDNIGRDLTNGVQSLSSKIDVVFAPLKLVTEKADLQDGRLKVLEAVHLVKAERRKTIRNAMLGLLLAGSGVIAEKLSTWIWAHWLVHFLGS